MKSKRIVKSLLLLLLAITLVACGKSVIKVDKKIETLYNEKDLGFETVKNVRMLSGYIGKDGKKVKENLLIRGGELSAISDKEIALLTDKYNVKKIIDFRSDSEINKAHDKEIKNSEYIHIPIFDENSNNVLSLLTNASKSKEEKLAMIDKVTGNDMIDAILYVYRKSGGIGNLYCDYFGDEYSHKQYRNFFDELLDGDGAVYFHCTSGKDRTGFASVLLLSVLGVDKETILDDYEMSAVPYVEKMRKIEKVLKSANVPDEDIIGVFGIIGVERDAMNKVLNLIDKDYGGMKNYLHEYIKLTDDEIKKLQDKYLE